MAAPPSRTPRAQHWIGIAVAGLSTLLAIAQVGCLGLPAVTNPPVQNSPPQVAAAASPDSGLVPLTVSFNGSASAANGTITSYLWDFGDGASSTKLFSHHIYSVPGNYTAALTATDSRSATATSRILIHAAGVGNQAPTATAAASPASGTAPLAVTFTGTGSDADGTIATYAWTFGDGGSASTQSPSHTYAAAGSFTATLTVTDNQGATASDQVTIAVTTPVNQPPTAGASASPTSGTAPLAVTFTGTGSDPDGSIASWAWSFGDGGTSSAQNPTHTYTAVGRYTAKLTVTDNQGASASATTAVSVTAVPDVPPVASAAAAPASGFAPLAVTFTGTGTDADGTVASYAWAFGDGGSSTLQNPTHTYTSVGSFTARLTVTDNLGATGSATVAITANASPNIAPVANAGPDQLNKDPGTAFALSGAGSSDPDGAIAGYAWTQVAGPAVTLTGAGSATPSFTSPLKTSASYSFKLTVTDNGATAKTASDTVVVSTRVTFDNGVGALLLARGTQPSGQLLGCTSSGCHTGTSSLSPLSTYAQVYSVRTSVKSKISSGGSMLKFLLSGEAPYIIAWIDGGAPQKN